VSDSKADEAVFVLERQFAAPPETVWRAWTDPVLLARWYKPMPTCETTVLHFDLRPEGTLLYQMRFGEGAPHIELWTFQRVEAPRVLEWTQSLADADGNVVDNERMPDWPRVLLTTIELESHPEGTLQTMTWRPHEASEVELACFAGAAENLGGRGWASGFENLKELVEGL
jgi:uncharacterized protein YndB with AHSA1/START domain